MDKCILEQYCDIREEARDLLGRIELEVTDDLGIHSAYKKARMGELTGYRFIVAASTFHDDACFAIKLPDLVYQGLKICGQMRNVKGPYKSLPTRTEDCYRAFSFGNINTYCVHVHKNVTPSFVMQLVSASFIHCPFNLLWCDTNAPQKRLNLHKTNAANEELVISLFYGREVQKRKPIYRLLHHYTA